MNKDLKNIVLYKALIQAKFPLEDKRIEISGSIHINTILRELREELKMNDLFQNLRDYPHYLDELKRTLNSISNNHLSQEQKIELLNEMIYPFFADNDLKNELLNLF